MATSENSKCLILLAIVSLLFLLSVPIKNTPTGDDYAYHKTVENFLGGELRLHPNISMTFVAQGLYGFLVASLIGFSYKNLVLGTILLSTLAVLVFYLLLTRLFNRKIAFLGALAMLGVPHYFYMSHTFLTDIPHLTIALVSIYLLYRGVESGRRSYIAGGVLASLAAFWIRQYGILPLAGLILYYFFNDRKELLRRRNILLLFALPALSVAVWFYWYYFVHGPSDCISGYFNPGLNVLRNIGKGALFVGYFIAPLGLFYLTTYKDVLKKFFSLDKQRKLAVLSLVATMAGWIAYIAVYRKNPIFYSYSILDHGGIDYFNIISGVKQNLLFSTEMWIPLTFLSIVVFASTFIYALSDDRKNISFVKWLAAAYALGLLFILHFYERYLIVFIPLFLIFALAPVSKHRHGMQFLLLHILVFGSLSWYGTYEHVSWDQTRWEGIDYLLSSGIPENKIDGGMEYNARFFERCNDPQGAVNWHGWGYSLSDEYVISFSELDGYETLKMIPYNGPFGEHLGDIVVLHKL